MKNKSFEQIVSMVFGPQTFVFILIVVLLMRTGLSNSQFLLLLPILLVFYLILPIGFVFFALESKQISAWDLPKLPERHKFLLITLMSYLAVLFLIYKVGNPLFFDLNLIFVVGSLLISFISIFWKISIHMSTLSTLIVFLYFLYGPASLLLALLLPVIFWSRLYLKRHTVSQLIAGTLVGAVSTAGLLYFFGYI